MSQSEIRIPFAMLDTDSGYNRISTGRTRDGVEVVFVNGKRVDEWLAEQAAEQA